jgi:pimeloyl-ACP methyl ester carboxylesterase
MHLAALLLRRLWRGAWGLLGWGLLLVLVSATAWAVYANVSRAQRETATPEALAAGQGRWVDTDDAALYLQTWGDAARPTVLLVHGTGAWSGTWFGLPQALVAAGWHVAAVDLPPFGLTGPAVSSRLMDYTRRAQAARLLALIDHLGGRVVLVGHSFGAGPALEAAMAARRQQLRQLVLVDAALGLQPDGQPPRCAPAGSAEALLQARTLRTALVGASATAPLLTATLLRQFVHRRDAVTDTLVPAYQQPFARVGFSAALGDWAVAFARATCEDAASLSPDLLQRWSRGSTPITLLWGEQDSITPLAQAQALQRWMPTARLTTLPGVGHIPHIEAPEAFARALLAAIGPGAQR